jgi:hypothetical protein
MGEEYKNSTFTADDCEKKAAFVYDVHVKIYAYEEDFSIVETDFSGLLKTLSEKSFLGCKDVNEINISIKKRQDLSCCISGHLKRVDS